MHISTLLYGGPGVGKTALAVSSFWDFLKREPIEGRNGRLLLIGREENDALGVPEENIVRFPLPQNNPIKFNINDGNLVLFFITDYCRKYTKNICKNQALGRTSLINFQGFWL